MRSVLNRLRVAITLVGLVPASLAAQQATLVSGVVTNVAGQPLPAVNVAIPSLGVGTVSRDDGRYSFSVPISRGTGVVTITARRIGLQQRSAQITLTGSPVTQNFQLTESVSQLEGLVVTALGQTREKSQLGTAVQQLTSEQLNTTHDPNIMNQLAGKVSGVNITGAGTQGGSVNVRIRGFTSITGNNGPLYVVDGIPISNSNRGGDPSGASSLSDGRDFGNAISDINSEDVENISVLKGPNAAALYGSRAANGVVMITTKKGGRGKSSTQISASNTWDKPSILPNYQNSYGQGSGGQFKYVDGAGGGIQDGNDQSFGPKLDGRLIDQFTGKQQPWVAHPDNVESFFKTGQTRNGNIAFSGGTEKASTRLSIGGENVDGIIPSSFLRKITGLANGSIDISDKMTATGSANYIRNTGQNRPGVGYNSGILEQFVWFGRQVDMNALRAQQYDASGNLFNWNSNFHNNPFWLQDANPELDVRDRTIVNGTLSYRPLSWLNATLRSGTDFYRYNIDQQYGAGNLNFADPSYSGGFSYLRDVSTENNTDLLLTANRDLGSRIAYTLTAGGSTRNQSASTEGVGTSGISVPGIYNVSNAAIAASNVQAFSKRRVNSAYGSASFTYNNWWTVEGTARNDWSSTLPKGENSYFYPSVNTSVVLTDAVPSLKGRGNLTFAKLRAAYAQVGADANPYQLHTTYAGSSNQFNGLPLYTLGNVIANADLKPEKTLSSEAGVELGFGDNRVTLDATYYTKATSNQIINLAVSNTSGYSSQSINAGKIENKGFEALLSVVPVRTNDVEWTSTFNYSQNKGKVVELYPGLSTIVLGGTWSATVEARVNEPYGVIRGYGIKKDAQGNYLLSGGLPQRDTLQVLGNVQPTWTGGWNNTLRYKGITINALLDSRIGGKIFSVTNMFGEYTGVLGSTLEGRENDWDNPGVIVKGIDVATGKENTIKVTSEDYFQNYFRLHERYVYDASYTKLREVRIGFALPQTIANKMYAQEASVSFIGRNLKTWTKVPNIDPEFAYSSSNYQGMEFASLPNPRSFGFDIRITP